ncbi:lysozyme inhibitor LprI family protein [Erythrobacter sp. CCH5-A1]|jgi:uncharacterized protein YecT (DUF1311 family)|uniref:lysozyme inhibitor LprI family protein n=1 Tax=Erythrobacter sp. CCH5-A1 TaxID=1768792 RepID=UPI0008321C4B|nr:lysozyme inhibitor LprI family protein [Erythrobacter sp. CCH5-A1]
MIATLIFPLLLQSAEPLPECNQAEADRGIQPEMNQCAWREFRIADAKLNAQWRITVAVMKDRDAREAPYRDKNDTRLGAYDSLLTAQRAWLTYRDAHCGNERYASTSGGSMEPMLVAFCMRELTQERIEQLKHLADPEL